MGYALRHFFFSVTLLLLGSGLCAAFISIPAQQGPTAAQKATWFVYEADLKIELPQTSEDKGPFKIQISRSFGDSKEEAMLRKAEAVYPGSPNGAAPIWGALDNDNILSTRIVTASAVRYYYDLTLAARKNPHLPSGFTAVATSLKYDGVIKHFDQYSHKKDSFGNVYVADLTLDWSFTCGGLCGIAFTRNKLVVLDSNGNVIAMYLDSPKNSQIMVS
jgi:hypothetical protein